MDKLSKKNLFVEIGDENILVAYGKYDDELNFQIIEKEEFSFEGSQKGKIIDLELCLNSLKKAISKIENKSNLFFSEVNVILNLTDFDCINVSGFKDLNGNQILSDDISYIINNIKSKLVDTEKQKTIIHLFNTKFLLDNKPIKNLPIGLHGKFYSHQLSFFLININELKNFNSLFNKCNLSVNKFVLKRFTDGIDIINDKQEDTFLNIKILRDEIYVTFFYESAFCFFQKFNFGSNIILKDISKVCSIDLSDVKNIISNSSFLLSDKNIYVDKKYFEKSSFRKISLKHIIEISSARIEEIANVLFNKNENLKHLKDKKNLLYLEIHDKSILKVFKNLFEKNFENCKLDIYTSNNEDPFKSIKISGELLSKGWAKEAIPIVNKKRSWITRIFSGLFE